MHACDGCGCRLTTNNSIVMTRAKEAVPQNARRNETIVNRICASKNDGWDRECLPRSATAIQLEVPRT